MDFFLIKVGEFIKLFGLTTTYRPISDDSHAIEKGSVEMQLWWYRQFRDSGKRNLIHCTPYC